MQSSSGCSVDSVAKPHSLQDGTECTPIQFKYFLVVVAREVAINLSNSDPFPAHDFAVLFCVEK